MRVDKVCILGGTGFVGRHLATGLVKSGRSCRIISRHPERYRELQVLPGLELRQLDPFDTESLAAAFVDCDAVINLIGILNENKKSTTFPRIHVELVNQIAEVCKSAGIRRFLHMSALNADAAAGVSQYLRTKGVGENQAHIRASAVAAVTSFRPSVIFGPGDSFFNRFASLIKLAPGVFPLACPNAKFAPVYVGDVVQAFIQSLEDEATFGQRYDLCGPRVLTLKELVRYTARILGYRTHVLGLNDFASRIQARVMDKLPGKPFSNDNYLSMQRDSVCSENGLLALGIQPTDIDTVVPAYLGTQTQRQRYQDLRAHYWDDSDTIASK